jgi:YidC/Oxa1 family membrane protein insertase
MDDKRPLVAILLILIIFLGFNYYYTRQMRQRTPTEAVEEAKEEAQAPAPIPETPVETRAPGEPAREAARTVTSGPEEITAVRSALWSATLTSRGAAISSWKLADYTDVQGDSVQLVSPAGEALAVEIRYGTELIDTRDWVFSGPRESTIDLVAGGGARSLTYEAERADGVRVVKEYTFTPGMYSFDLRVSVLGLDAPAAERDLVIGWPGVPPTEAKEDRRTALASVAMVDGKVVRAGFSRLSKESQDQVGQIAWATSQSKYFIAALVPEGGSLSRVEAYADTAVDAGAFAATIPLDAGGGTRDFRVFAGPQDFRLVSAMGDDLARAVDLGWSWMRPLSVVMLRALVWAHGVIPNYGIVIIIFSVLTKLLFYRLTHKSFTEMKRMQELQPRLEELKKKYGNNREELSRAQMRLYQEAGVNPLGSCLPMLLQMPVFIALYQVLRTTIELRGAPFALWITDLSQPDTIAMVGTFSIHILPVLMGVGMLVQQRYSSGDPSQAAMGKMMPILFTVLFYNIASGLVLYWLVNTVLSVAQQAYVHRGYMAAAETRSDAAAPSGVPAGAVVPSVPDNPGPGVPAPLPASSPAGTKRTRRGGKKKRKKR